MHLATSGGATISAPFHMGDRLTGVCAAQRYLGGLEAGLAGGSLAWRGPSRRRAGAIVMLTMRWALSVRWDELRGRDHGIGPFAAGVLEPGPWKVAPGPEDGGRSDDEVASLPVAFTWSMFVGKHMLRITGSA